jgi:hypothetical protein
MLLRAYASFSACLHMSLYMHLDMRVAAGDATAVAGDATARAPLALRVAPLIGTHMCYCAL